MSRLPDFVRDFVRDQKGAVTIEFTTLVPAFVLMLVFFVDASIIYFTQSEMFNVARDIARKISTQQFTTRAEVEAYAAEHLHLGERTYVVSPDFGADIEVSIGVPVSQAAIFGHWFTPIIGRNLIAVAAMRKEPLN